MSRKNEDDYRSNDRDTRRGGNKPNGAKGRKPGDFDFVPTNASRPIREEKQPKGQLLSEKALSGLPKSGSSITVKAEPYDIILPGSDPYAYINRLNPKAGGNYGGRMNMDGGITQQMLSSELSTALHSFDSAIMRVKVNYRYLPISKDDTKRGIGIAREMINAIAEVLSLAKSTTFTQLAILNYYIESEIPVPKEYTFVISSLPEEFKNGKEDGTYLYYYAYGVAIVTKKGDSWTLDRTLYHCGQAVGLYLALIHYQLVLQSIAQCFNAYNKFRANQGAMMKMSWNREVATLNSYFSLFNKQAFQNMWKSISMTLNGEYFDKDWMKQFNLIASLTSRRSNAMTDPLLEISCNHELAGFSLNVIAAGTSDVSLITEVFSSKQMDEIAKSVVEESAGVTGFADMMNLITMRLSVNNTLYWARNIEYRTKHYEQDRFNELVSCIKAITSMVAIFKPAMSDLRTMLDTIARTGVIKWSKSEILGIFNNINSPVLNNFTLNDMFKSLLSGGAEAVYDTSTFRWRVATPWDYWNGIPEYDALSGGSFLTFSLKEIKPNSDDPTQQDYLPVLVGGFLDSHLSEAQGSGVTILNRLGTSVDIFNTKFQASVNSNTARLVPLSNLSQSFLIKAPYVKAATWSGLDIWDQSYLRQAMLKIADIFSPSETVNASTDLAVNPDWLTLTVVEVDDLVNEMITYARTSGPFIVNVADGPKVGFLGLE